MTTGAAQASAHDSAGPTVPLLELSDAVVARLAHFGAPDRAKQANLYRALANHEELLIGWLELSWRLRQQAVLPRRLRELMIVRGAFLSGSDYERRNHEELALANGVSAQELVELVDWESSQVFSEPERASFAMVDAMHAGDIPDEVVARAKQQFGPAELVELVVTAGFYFMLPQVLSALRVPLEDRHRAK
ncbi:MAG: carboxymuconolactone decarboxylase family protein [Actinomycetota bacterium]